MNRTVRFSIVQRGIVTTVALPVSAAGIVVLPLPTP
jgi:hypothetical protein